MKIGIVFEGNEQIGGGYQQQLTSLKIISSLNMYQFIIFVFTKENKKHFEELGFSVVLVTKNSLSRLINFIFRSDVFIPFLHKFKIKNTFEKQLDIHNIDLVYFLYPSELSLDLVAHNYIITVWDLCHRDYFEFPEVNFYKTYEWRELLYQKSLLKAVSIIVDSQYSKENVIRRYGIDAKRIEVVPFSPSESIQLTCNLEVKLKYGIDKEYIYYPAQFWAHKNHIYIIDALKILHDNGVQLYAVFSGSDQGNLKNVLRYAKLVKMEKFIKYIGFVPKDEIASLYKHSLALVMPTYFGPTNIPPLEAFALGCPVIYSDLEGLRDQVGDAALLCDLENPNSLAIHINTLMNNLEFRSELVKKGFKKLGEIQKVSLSDILIRLFKGYFTKYKNFKVID